MGRPLTAGAAVLALSACTAIGTTAETAPGSAAERDSGRFMVPAGYGSLRQEDIAIRLRVLGLQVQAIPLDESVIRVLSPDSYRAMRELVNSQRPALDALSRRMALRDFSLWDVRFHGDERGEAVFSPQEFIITSVGRDFRPIDIIPLTAGFGRQRLRQRDTQRAIYVFDPRLDVNQPLVVQYESARSTEWATILSRIERERSLVRTRAGARKP